MWSNYFKGFKEEESKPLKKWQESRGRINNHKKKKKTKMTIIKKGNKIEKKRREILIMEKKMRALWQEDGIKEGREVDVVPLAKLDWPKIWRILE